MNSITIEKPSFPADAIQFLLEDCDFGAKRQSFTMANDWRCRLQELIRTQLLECNFRDFDGISYSFELSNECLGLVRIEDQRVRGYSSFDRVFTRVGALHYQLSFLQSQIGGTSHALWMWTLGNLTDSGWRLPFLEVLKDESKESKESKISELISSVLQEGVPYMQLHYPNISSIAKYFEETGQCTKELLCLTLAADGQIAKSRRLADSISTDLKAAGVNRNHWPIFESKFERWLTDGAHLPNLAEARQATEEAAKSRREMISKMPVHLRPVW